MKILHIAPTPFFADRGCHIRIYEEIRHLQKLGHLVTLTTYHIGRDPDNIETFRITYIPWYKKLEAGGSWHKLYLDTMLLWLSLRICIKGKPEVIHGHLHEGALIGWLVSLVSSGGRKPLVFDVQGSLSGELQAYGLVRKNCFIKKVFKGLEKLICKLPDRFVCSSKASAKMILHEMNVAPNKVTILMDGVPLRKFQNTHTIDHEIKRKLGIIDSDKIVLYAGSLLKSKGIDFFLDAIPIVLKNYGFVKFVIVGHPVEYCQQRIEELKITDSVILTGQVNYFDLFSYLAAGDIAVDPKIEGANEGSGKIINYMAAGLPVVCFNTVNNRTFLQENGIFAKAGDSSDLGQKILDLLNNEDLAEKIGSGNLMRAQKSFSWESNAKTLEQIYTTIRI